MGFLEILGAVLIVAFTGCYVWMAWVFFWLGMGHSSESIIAKIRELDLDISLKPVFITLSVFMACSVVGGISSLIIYLQMV